MKLSKLGICGIVSFLSYTAMVIFSPFAYPGYDWLRMAVSDLSAVGTIVSAGYGFLCGAYMPISSFSAGLRRVLSFLPGTYGTSLLRNHALGGGYREMEALDFPAEVVETIKDSIDCNLYFFGEKVGLVNMYVVLAASVVLAVGIFVLMNMLSGRRLYVDRNCLEEKI